MLSLQSSADFDKSYCSRPDKCETPGAATAKQRDNILTFENKL